MSNDIPGGEVGQFYDMFTPLFQIIWRDTIHFGYWADPTDEQLALHAAQQRLTDVLIAQTGLQPGQHALDVGCGLGRPAIALAQQTGAQVTGINLSRVQVDCANELAQQEGVAEQVRFEVADALALPYAADTFDLAWAIESTYIPERVTLFQELVRVVRPGGRVMVVDAVLARPLTEEQAAVLCPLFGIPGIGTLEEHLLEMKQAGLVQVTCQDVTANVIRPNNQRVLAAMYDEAIVAQLQQHYDAAFIQAFQQGWEVFAAAEDRFFYVILTGVCPGVALNML